MDRSLRKGTGRNRRRRHRNYGAWERFSTDGQTCPYCPHDGALHLVQSAQPHFFRKATANEENSHSISLYQYTPPGGDRVLLKRMTVARNAEIITAFCTACAEAMNTSQVLCFQRNTAVGEVVGMRTDNNKRKAATLPDGD